MHFRLSLMLALVGLLIPTSPAGARQADEQTIEIGRVSVGTTADGRTSFLVPIRYGIQLAGRAVETRVWLNSGGVERNWVIHDRLSSGRRRSPERRRSFVFVHRIDFGRTLAEQLGGKAWVRVVSPNRIDVDGDGKYELGVVSAAVRPVTQARRRLCSSIPRLRVRPGRTISVPLPACGERHGWTLSDLQHGRARIRSGRLVYRAPRRFRGSVEIKLVEAVPAATASRPRRRPSGLPPASLSAPPPPESSSAPSATRSPPASATTATAPR